MNRRLIKNLSLLFIIALVLCGVSVSAHSHKGDPFHIKHHDCPVFRFEKSFQNIEILAWSWVIYLVVFFCENTPAALIPIRLWYYRIFGRDPPVRLGILGESKSNLNGGRYHETFSFKALDYRNYFYECT